MTTLVLVFKKIESGDKTKMIFSLEKVFILTPLPPVPNLLSHNGICGCVITENKIDLRGGGFRFYFCQDIIARIVD